MQAWKDYLETKISQVLREKSINVEVIDFDDLALETWYVCYYIVPEDKDRDIRTLANLYFDPMIQCCCNAVVDFNWGRVKTKTTVTVSDPLHALQGYWVTVYITNGEPHND